MTTTSSFMSPLATVASLIACSFNWVIAGSFLSLAAVDLIFDRLGGSFCVSFRSLRGCPERAWINPVRMQCQHLLVKVQGGRCTCHGSVKVMKVASGFLDVTRRAIGVKHAMT